MRAFRASPSVELLGSLSSEPLQQSLDRRLEGYVILLRGSEIGNDAVSDGLRDAPVCRCPIRADVIIERDRHQNLNAPLPGFAVQGLLYLIQDARAVQRRGRPAAGLSGDAAVLESFREGHPGAALPSAQENTAASVHQAVRTADVMEHSSAHAVTAPLCIC